jgi:hypothetical protein
MLSYSTVLIFSIMLILKEGGLAPTGYPAVYPGRLMQSVGLTAMRYPASVPERIFPLFQVKAMRNCMAIFYFLCVPH